MVWLLKGSPVIRTSAKWLSVWMHQWCKCDLPNTHRHDLTTIWLKLMRHTCSTRLTDGASNKRDTYDWLLIDRENGCAIINVTLCLCNIFFHSEHNMYTCREYLEHDENMVASKILSSTWKTFGGMNKKGGCEGSYELMEWTQVYATSKWNSQWRLWICVQTKILEGGYIATTTLGNTLVELQILCFGSLIA